MSRVAIGSSVAIGALALIGAWRWWLAPWQAAAKERDAPELVERRAAAIEALAELGVAITLDDRRVAAEALQWRAPGECIEVYRLRVDERYRDASVATFLGRPETHASYFLGLVTDPTRSTTESAIPVLGVLTHATDEPRVRELWWGPLEVGPSAPDFACRRRDWDLVEDALALGWPKLPGTSMGVGERWLGAVVGGRCHETVCLEPDGKFGGRSGPQTPCQARPWSEQLAGADDQLALILGGWDDGHDPARAEIGILTSRELVLDEGRPLHVGAVIDQRWAGVRRELSLLRIDDCGLRRVGGRPDAIGDARGVEETRARTRDAIRARLPRSPAPR